MSTQANSFLTPQQYLEIERKAEVRSEYYRGQMFAMSGTSWEHNQITHNLHMQLGGQLRSGPCRMASNDMRVLIPVTGLYTYPDVVVVCGKPQFEDAAVDTLMNPTLIIEILSHSTEAYDRGKKFGQYRSIESLRAYLMIASEWVGAELHTRQPDGWLLAQETQRLEDTIDIECIGCRLKMADLYEGVELPSL